MKKPFTVYFGGELFDHKDLTGNAMLASHIEKQSKGRYVCFLPQNLNQADATALEIRNQDLKEIVECDVAVFNFEGAELDSGTVVEFIFAKLLDIPSVILRSDFRSSGEKDLGGEDWNLMCSFYPRTEIVQFSAIALHQEALGQGGDLNRALDRLYTDIASRIVESLDSVRRLDAVFKGDKEQLKALYQWAVTFPGGNLEALFSDAAFAERIVAAKVEKRLV